MTDLEKAGEWLAFSKSYILTAHLLYGSARRSQSRMVIGYSCQIASEMAVRSLSIALGLNLDDGHSIAQMLSEIKRETGMETAPIDVRVGAVRLLKYAGTTRYPDAYDDSSEWKEMGEDRQCGLCMKDMTAICKHVADCFDKLLHKNIPDIFKMDFVEEQRKEPDITSKQVDGAVDNASSFLTYSRSFNVAVNEIIRRTNRVGKMNNEDRRLFCHYCHQAVEMMLKGLLCQKRIPYDSTHNLCTLLKMALSDKSGKLDDAASVLREYSCDKRYPEKLHIPTSATKDPVVKASLSGMQDIIGSAEKEFGGFGVDIDASLGMIRKIGFTIFHYMSIC